MLLRHQKGTKYEDTNVRISIINSKKFLHNKGGHDNFTWDGILGNITVSKKSNPLTPFPYHSLERAQTEVNIRKSSFVQSIYLSKAYSQHN